MKYQEIVNNKEINAYLKKGDANLGTMGFTDHSKAHCIQVSHRAGKILEKLGYSKHDVELAKIAGSFKRNQYANGRPDYHCICHWKS